LDLLEKSMTESETTVAGESSAQADSCLRSQLRHQSRGSADGGEAAESVEASEDASSFFLFLVAVAAGIPSEGVLRQS
jgi:hypothetical protein